MCVNGVSLNRPELTDMQLPSIPDETLLLKLNVRA